MSNKSIDDFMSWLDCMVETYTMDDSYNPFEFSTHERHEKEGMVKMLLLVEQKAKKVGFITPNILGGSL